MVSYETLLRAAWLYYARKVDDLGLSKTSRNQAAELRNQVGLELDAYERGQPMRFLEAFDTEPERKLQHIM